MTIRNMAKLMTGRKQTGIAPSSPTIKLGMMLAAINNAQSETNDTITAFFLMALSSLVEIHLGSALFDAQQDDRNDYEERNDQQPNPK